MERLEEERGRHLVEVEETKFRMDMFDEETKAKLDFGGEEEKEATASVVRQHLLSASLSPLISWRLSIEYFMLKVVRLRRGEGGKVEEKR